MRPIEPGARWLEPRAPRPRAARRRPLILVVGNPNVGKTTLFNALTGESARIGNYPGITVERREAALRLPGAHTADLVDAPGAYSLSARSTEEQITIDAVLGLHDNPAPDLVLMVVDAGQLVRNLYLAIQLIEARVPLVLALNMIDEVADMPPSPGAITEVFGVPCVATDARRGKGILELKQALATALSNSPTGKVDISYPECLTRDLERVVDALPPLWRTSAARDRALALWALTSLDEDDELRQIDEGLRRRCGDVRGSASERDLDQEIIETRYRFLDEIAPRLYGEREQRPKPASATERLDRVLLHPVFGFAIFIVLMLVVFQSLFSWSEPAMSLIEDGVGALQGVLGQGLSPGFFRDLLVEGVVGGVGNVMVFIPQILLLFLFIGLLEDSGYMSRVAFLMDRVMKPMGLHGRAFVPMLAGLACAVPAILATRTMERRRDRLLTMLVIPLMTCSARLPVYTLIVTALFAPHRWLGWLPLQGMLMVGLYLFSLIATLAAALVLGRTVVRGQRVPLILELPPYRLPNLRTTLRMMGERAWVFIKDAGTVILALTIVIWALLSFPALPTTDQACDDGVRSSTTGEELPAAPDLGCIRPSGHRSVEHSYAGQLGHALEPLVAPLGFDWKLGVGIIGAFAAREVFVSTMGVVYGMEDLGEDATPLRARMREERRPDGSRAYTPLVGLSLLAFFALACQCMSTLAALRRETKSWTWPAFLFGYTTGLAWLASLVVYQGGRWLGFS